MKKNRLARFKIEYVGLFGLSLAVLFFVFIPHSSAIIVNESNDLVEVEAVKSDGQSERIRIFPSQSAEIPQKAVELKVVPKMFVRGDEVVRVRVEQADGTVSYIKKFNQTFKLGVPMGEEEVFPELIRQVTNMSNNAVPLAVTKKNGTLQIMTILPKQSMILPEDTREVGIDKSGFMRGDESIQVEIIIPSGEKRTIANVSAKVSFEEVKT